MTTCVSFSTVSICELFLGIRSAGFGINALDLAVRTHLAVRPTFRIRHFTEVQEY